MVFARVLQIDNLVKVVFDGTPENDEDAIAYFTTIEKIYEEKKSFLILYDARDIGVVSPRHINLQVQFIKKNRQHTLKFVTRGAILMKSRVAQKMLQLVFMFRTPAPQFKTFNESDRADAYLRDGTL